MSTNTGTNKKRFRLFTLTTLAAGVTAVMLGYTNVQLSAQTPAPSVIETNSHRFSQIADGVYHYVGTGAVNVMSNGMLVVGENDLLLVDSHVTPGAARALLDAVKAVSDKPVRYLVNSHYHFDHAHGNQVFPADVEIIGHSFTRAKLNGEMGNVLEESTFISFTEGVPAQIANLQTQIAEATDADRKAALEAQLSTALAHQTSLAEIVPTPPNITLEKELTLYQTVMQGSREIQILHTGRGHTGGDVVVFLPQEKLLFTGDLLLPGLSYMGDAFAQDWPNALEALRALDFDTVLPGHGAPMQGKEKIDHFQAYLRDLWTKTASMKQQGLTWQQTAEQIDMTNHSNNYAQIRSAGADPRAIRRIYELLDAE